MPQMLNELESLLQNIGRLISISEMLDQSRRELEQQREKMRTEAADMRSALERLAAERDALRFERDTLLAKIDDAQVRLNAILEQLPHQRDTLDIAHAQRENV
jgi:uncharacterized coiled-coil DUF342 family protein